MSSSPAHTANVLILKSEFIIASLCYATKSGEELEQYKDRWILDETLITILQAHYWSHDELNYTKTDLVKALRCKKVLFKYKLGDTEDFIGNTSGLFQVPVRLATDTSKNIAFFISSHASESTQVTKKRTDVPQMPVSRKSTRRKLASGAAAAVDSSEVQMPVIMQPKSSCSKFWDDWKTAYTAICNGRLGYIIFIM